MLDVVISPNPILLQKCKEVSNIDSDINELAAQMLETMYECDGIGLAAPQVGKPICMIVIDCDYDYENPEETKNPIVLINPKILEKSGEVIESTEGCLSCPGITAPVLRHSEVKVEYTDLDGKTQTIEGDDLLSFCLQHEIDHLEGKTLFQTSLPEARLNLISEYEEALKNGAKPGQVG